MTTNRKTIALRQFVGVSLALFALLATLGFCHGCKTLTPTEQAAVAKDDVTLGACFATGHLCKVAAKFSDAGPDAGMAECWAEYETCMVSHGYRDGGK